MASTARARNHKISPEVRGRVCPECLALAERDSSRDGWQTRICPDGHEWDVRRLPAHWLTRYDPDDGEPYGQVCECVIGEDHDASDGLVR